MIYQYDVSIDLDNTVMTLVPRPGTPAPVGNAIVVGKGQTLEMQFFAEAAWLWNGATFWPPNSPSIVDSFIEIDASTSPGKLIGNASYELSLVELDPSAPSVLKISNVNTNQGSFDLVIGMRFRLRQTTNGLVFMSEDPQIRDKPDP